MKTCACSMNAAGAQSDRHCISGYNSAAMSGPSDNTAIDLQTRILAAVDHYWQLAYSLYPEALGQTACPAIRFDLGGSSAGQVQFTRRLWRVVPVAIRFNPHIAEHNRDRFIDRTVAHEIAHAVAVLVHGRKALGHGMHWRQIMNRFGQPAERCHDYDLSEVRIRRQRRFIYHCACPDEQLLSTVRHKRQQGGERRYYCRRCRSPLSFSGSEKT